MSDLKYSEYEDMYPETVVIRKEGVFYTVRGQGALVCHNFFDYKCWKNDKGVVSMGFVENGLEIVCRKLREESISHIVLYKGEMIAGEDYDEKNRFNDFLSADINDIPFREPNKKKGKHTYNILAEDEKRLCDISIKYLERLIDGRHPVNNSWIEDDTVLTDQNIQRCFSFVVDVLKRINNTQQEEKKRSEKREKIQSATFRSDFNDVIDRMIIDREVRMSELEELIQPYLGDLFIEKIEKIPAVRISNWLLDNGYLVSVSDTTGSKHREASEDGKIIGISNAIFNLDNGSSYVQYRFTPKAQRFVFENLTEIAFYKRKK